MEYLHTYPPFFFFLLFETLCLFWSIYDSVQNISAFLIRREEFKVANELSLLVDKVGEVATQKEKYTEPIGKVF